MIGDGIRLPGKTGVVGTDGRSRFGETARKAALDDPVPKALPVPWWIDDAATENFRACPYRSGFERLLASEGAAPLKIMLRRVLSVGETLRKDKVGEP
jgi:hypothetical protein